MASLIKVDEMEANSATLMKFNTGAYNSTWPVAPADGIAVWNPEVNPVAAIVWTGPVVISPTVPTVNGMYMTVVYPDTLEAIAWSGYMSFDNEIPDTSGGHVHRVYYSRNNLWWDA